MANFLSHLVQRALAASPAMMPRLAGPYEGSRESVAPPVGDGADEAIATLELAREQAGPRGDLPTASFERSGRELASALRGSESATTRSDADRLVPQDSHDQSDVPAAPRADASAVAAVPPTRAPRPALLEAESDTVSHRQPIAHATQAIEPGHSASLSASIQSRDQVPRLRQSMLRQDVQAAPGSDEQRALLDAVDAPRRHSTDLTDRGDGPPANVDASRASIVPPVALSPPDPAARPKAGMLVEPPVPQASAQQQAHGPAPSAEPTPPVAAPTVHVTIGRIELRAAAPAAAPARSRPAASRPALSLADYLDRRTTGGRS